MHPADDTADITIWTSIEGNAIIIAACIPTLQPLLDRFFGGGIFGSTRNGQQRGAYRSHKGSRVELTLVESKNSKSLGKHRKMGASDPTLGHDSQASILASECRNTKSRTSTSQEPSGILRTQHVMIKYAN